MNTLASDKAVILIVDSDPILLTGTAAVLHTAGYECHCARDSQVALKAAMDRVGAAVGLLLLSPLFGAIALAVRFTSPGPVFHRAIRYGRHGAPFSMWKFRTMVVDAEARKAEFAAANENDGLMFKMRRDPRVTRIGRVLRRCSLDELPQLRP